MGLEDHDNHVGTEEHTDEPAEHGHVEHIHIHISEIIICCKSHTIYNIDSTMFFWSLGIRIAGIHCIKAMKIYSPQDCPC